VTRPSFTATPPSPPRPRVRGDGRRRPAEPPALTALALAPPVLDATGRDSDDAAGRPRPAGRPSVVADAYLRDGANDVVLNTVEGNVMHPIAWQH
jgi:hypothetical protein